MTSTIGEQDAAVSPEQITEIAQEVWESFLSMSLLPHPLGPDAPALEGQTVIGCVHVSGEWTGSVFLSCHVEVAAAAAEAMFAADPGSLSTDEISDALGELTNMVGGNIKSLLPEPSQLSIPSVTAGTNSHVFVPAARPALEVPLRCGEAVVRVTLWQA